MVEEWRIVTGHEKYRVSNLGNLQSSKRGDWKDMKLGEGMRYPKVKLDGKQISVHKLVADAFIPNPDNKPCIAHLNGVGRDNRVENLAWATYSELSNNEERKRKVSKANKGRKRGSFSEEHRRKMSEAQKARRIREREEVK